jgi:hypothetical protein
MKVMEPPLTANGYEEPDDTPDWQALDPDEYALVLHFNYTPAEAREEMARRREVGEARPPQFQLPAME